MRSSAQHSASSRPIQTTASAGSTTRRISDAPATPLRRKGTLSRIAASRNACIGATTSRAPTSQVTRRGRRGARACSNASSSRAGARTRERRSRASVGSVSIATKPSSASARTVHETIASLSSSSRKSPRNRRPLSRVQQQPTRHTTCLCRERRRRSRCERHRLPTRGYLITFRTCGQLIDREGSCTKSSGAACGGGSHGISRAVIRFVAPAAPVRRPAVMTTRAPVGSPANFLAVSRAVSISSSTDSLIGIVVA
jgi:hypothetical protein